MTSWVSVADRLPEIDSQCIVYMAAHEHWYEAIYRGDKHFEIAGDEGWNDMEEITHWAYIHAPEDEEKK